MTTTTALGYARVSTIDQEESGLGLAAQVDSITTEAGRRGWDLVDIVEDTASGSLSIEDRKLGELVDRIEAGEADTLIVAKLDRVARSVMHFSTLMARARDNGWAIVIADASGVDTTTPVGQLLANILISMAQFERDMISARTKAALAVKARNGEQVGRHPTTSPEVADTIVELRDGGLSCAKTAAELERLGIPTSTGGTEWRPATVSRIDRRRRVALDRLAVA